MGHRHSQARGVSAKYRRASCGLGEVRLSKAKSGAGYLKRSAVTRRRGQVVFGAVVAKRSKAQPSYGKAAQGSVKPWHGSVLCRDGKALYSNATFSLGQAG